MQKEIKFVLFLSYKLENAGLKVDLTFDENLKSVCGLQKFVREWQAVKNGHASEDALR